MDEARRRITQNTTQINSVVETLRQGMEGIKTEIGNVAQSMSNLSSASARNRQALQQEAATMDDVWATYRKMGIEMKNLEMDMSTLKLSEKEMNKIVQLGTDYNQKRADSYTALSQKYRAVKILIDQMTTAERENTEAGRNLVASAREWYEQMNLLQQRTGKYQLQVGDYSKAMTGLNIATNQVVRELPVLANGVSMFAIAISNNIPILADNIVQVKRYNDSQVALQKELLKTAEAHELAGRAAEAQAARESAAAVKTTSVLSALGKALFSWQTALVLVLTVLPGLIRKIQEKKKATEELNGKTKEQITLVKLLGDAMRDVDKEVVRSTSEVVTLSHIINDNNRSIEDRIGAGERLKQIYEDELANLSAEEIALGKAKIKIDEITESVAKQARARAILNKITEAYTKQIDRENDALTIGATKVEEFGFGTISNLYEYVQTKMEQTQWSEDYIKKQIAFITKGDKDVWSRYAKYKQAMEDMKKYTDEIVELEKRLQVGGLLEDEDGGGRRRGKEKGALTIPDYYYEMLMASAEALDSELDRRLAILETNWFKERDGYAQHVKELVALREEAQKQGNAIQIEEANQQIQNLILLLRLGQERYDDEVKRIIRERVESYAEQVVDDAVAEDIPGKIVNKMRRGRKYGGIVEAILAQTKRFGEGNKFGQGIIKEEYANFVTSVDQALKTSMGFMDEWMDKRLEMAKIAVEAAEKEVAAAQKVLDFEMEARANGYANRVETARKELDLEREQHRKALEEQKRLQEQQLLFDSISQTSSLITATANIWEAMTKGTGLLGPGLAIAATTLLWGSFAAAKIKAKELAGLQAEQYGEGTVELLEGGSHASGHDIDLGRKKDGTPRRAEGGEFFAVINKRNSRRFRSIIPDVINSFNDGTFGEKYQKANEAMGNFALGLLAGNSPTDVSALERDVHAIKEQGDEHRYMDSMGNTIIRYKNLTRKISKS